VNRLILGALPKVVASNRLGAWRGDQRAAARTPAGSLAGAPGADQEGLPL